MGSCWASPPPTSSSIWAPRRSAGAILGGEGGQKKPHKCGIFGGLLILPLFPHFRLIFPVFHPVFSPFSSSGTSDRFTRILQHILTQRRYRLQPPKRGFFGAKRGDFRTVPPLSFLCLFLHAKFNGVSELRGLKRVLFGARWPFRCRISEVLGLFLGQDWFVLGPMVAL